MIVKLRNAPFTGLMATTLLFGSLPGISQEMAYAGQKEVQEQRVGTQATQLKDVLNVLKSKYQVDIMFELRSVDGLTVPASVINTEQSLERNLDKVLTPFGLKFRKVNRQSYLVLDERKRHKPASRAVPDREKPSRDLIYNADQPARQPHRVIQLPSFLKEVYAARQVSGKVTDEEGAGLPGVSILVKGTQQGTTTDPEGRFNLVVPDGEMVLVFSFVGFVPQEVTVGNRSVIDIRMVVDAKSLEELIVVGYGSVKKENLTSSISKIGSEAIAERPIPTLSEAFAGQLAGVRAQSTSGIPGQELQIQIRGVNTINGNSSPLYVVDGVPKDNMNDINPSDVESIQILKDASATAIYGARGGNGVVLIETKRGAGKPTVSLDAMYGFQDPEKFVGMMSKDEWGAYHIWTRNDQWLRQGGSMSDPMDARPVGLQIPGEWLDPNRKGTDWQRAITRVAPFQSYQVSVSGKNDLGSIFISGGYMGQEGIIKETYYNRFNFRANGTLNVGKKTQLGLNLSPSFSDQDDRDTQGKETPIHHALNISPLVQLNEATRDWGFPAGIGQVYPNPLERIRETTDRTQRSRFSSVVWGEHEILPQLKFRSQLGYDYEGIVYEFFQAGNVGYNNGFLTQGNSNSRTSNNWSIQNTLSYDKEFGGHVLNFLLGQSAEGRKYYQINATATGFPNELIETLNVATTPTTASTTRNQSRIASFFGRVGYTFQDRYLLNMSIRRDGSSRFGDNHKWGIFPAVSAGWKINAEPFLNHVGWLSLLKVRAAWGTSGNDRIGNYDYMSRLSITRASWGNAVVGGLAPANIENPNLKWEATSTTNFGLDVSTFSNRLQVNFDYYINRTDNLLFNLPIPNTTGFGSYRTNIGSVQNKGWEIDLTTLNSVGTVRWTTSLNLSANRNKVLDMGGIREFTSTNWDARFITRVGGPISQFLVYRTDGLLMPSDFDSERKALVPILPGQEPGNVRYIDQNDDGVINANDQVPYGNNLPDLIYGFTNRVTWKNIELSFLLQGQLGGDVLFLGQRQMDNGGQNINSFKRWVHAWKPDYEALYGQGENPVPDNLGVDMSWDGYTPYTKGNKSDNNSDFRIYDATFLRIRNITLSYRLPVNDLGLKMFKSARIYVTVDNLKTFDRYPGVTPETNSFGNATTQAGVDYSTYPLSKKYTFGVSLNF